MKPGRPQVIEPMELSMEDLYLFKQCPLRWRLSKTELHMRERTKKEELADKAKEMIQWYYTRRMEGLLPSYDQVKRHFSDLLYGGKIDSRQVMRMQRVKPERGDIVNMEQKLIKGVLEMVGRDRAKEATVVAVSKKYRVKISDTLYLTGEIPVVRDVEGQIELVWVKTSFSDASEFYYLTDMGLTFLQLAWNSVKKQPAQRVVVFDAVSGKERAVIRSREDYKRLVEIAKMTEAMIRQNLIMPREQKGCNSCPKRMLCAQWKGWKN